MPVWCGCFTPTTQRVSAAATLLIPLLFRRWSLPCNALPAKAVADRLIAFPQLGRSELLLRASLLFTSVPSHTPLSRSFAVSAVSYAVRRFSDADQPLSGLCLCPPFLLSAVPQRSLLCPSDPLLCRSIASRSVAGPFLSFRCLCRPTLFPCRPQLFHSIAVQRHLAPLCSSSQHFRSVLSASYPKRRLAFPSPDHCHFLAQRIHCSCVLFLSGLFFAVLSSASASLGELSFAISVNCALALFDLLFLSYSDPGRCRPAPLRRLSLPCLSMPCHSYSDPGLSRAKSYLSLAIAFRRREQPVRCFIIAHPGPVSPCQCSSFRCYAVASGQNRPCVLSHMWYDSCGGGNDE